MLSFLNSLAGITRDNFLPFKNSPSESMEAAMMLDDTTIRKLLENLGNMAAPRKVPNCRISAAKMAEK